MAHITAREADASWWCTGPSVLASLRHSRPETGTRGAARSSQGNGDCGMSDGDVIRAVYPRDTMKRVARLMDVPLDTARHWIYRNLSAARRKELGDALIAELDSQQVGLIALRRRLAQWAASEASRPKSGR